MIRVKIVEKIIEEIIKKDLTVAVGTSEISLDLLGALALKEVFDDYNLKIVPTSVKIAELAKGYDLKLSNPNEKIDLVIEFASEVDKLFNYAKRETESLIRDKIIAYYGKQVVVFVDESGFKERISEFPVEVAKFGLSKTINALSTYGVAKLRNGKTLGNNYIVDLGLDKMYSFDDLEFKVKEIPGVLETGLFINMADRIFVVGKQKAKKVADFLVKK